PWRIATEICWLNIRKRPLGERRSSMGTEGRLILYMLNFVEVRQTSPGTSWTRGLAPGKVEVQLPTAQIVKVESPRDTHQCREKSCANKPVASPILHDHRKKSHC